MALSKAWAHSRMSCELASPEPSAEWMVILLRIGTSTEVSPSTVTRWALWVLMREGGRRGGLFKFVYHYNVGLESDFQAVGVARTHYQGAIAEKVLVIVHFAVVCAVGGVVEHHLGFGPVGLKIVTEYRTSQIFSAHGEGGAETVVMVWCSYWEDVAELGELCLLAWLKEEAPSNVACGKFPLDFETADTGDNFFILGDQFRLVIAKVKTVFEAKACREIFPVEGRDKDVATNGQLGEKDGDVAIDWPIKDAGHVRESERV